MKKRMLLERQREWLLEEIDTWRAESIVSDDQASRILGLYETTVDTADRRRSQAVFVLMSAAALLLGFAVLLLIGYNWSEMSRAAKLVIIFGVIAGTHAAGFYLRYRQQAPRLSEVLFFLGCLFYGAGIWLVAQVFHLDAHYPNGVWIWAIGVAVFALCLDTLLLHALLVFLLGLWAGMEVLNFGHLGGWLFGRWSWIPNGAYTLPLLAIPGLAWAYRKGSVPTVALYVALLAWWGMIQPFAWRWEPSAPYIVGFIGSIAALLIAVGEAHRVGSRFAIPYRTFGVLLAAGVLVLLSYEGFNREISRNASNTGVGMMLVALALPAIAIGLIALRRALSRRLEADPPPIAIEVRELLRREWLPLALMLLMTFVSLSAGFWSVAQNAAFPFDQAIQFTPVGYPILIAVVLANLGMLALAFWLM